MKPQCRHLLLGSLFACLVAQPVFAEIHPMVGNVKTIKVQKKESLYQIARSEDVNIDFLRKLNHLKRNQVHPGQSLMLPTLRILPRLPAHGIVLNIPERQVYLFKDGQFLTSYPVGVGQASWQTATGEFTLAHKAINPQWKPTKEMVERTDIKDDPVPPGKDNPVGDRWMGWSKPGYGFHSTISPETVGTIVSHGCVRLYPEAAHKMFDQVNEGETIYSLYEPLLLGERNGKIFLSAFSDIYHKKNGGMDRLKLILKKEGLLPLVNMKSVAQIVAARDGFPRRILGEDRGVSVNGKEIKTDLAPIQKDGHWIVALKPIIEALGGQISSDSRGRRKITSNGHTLTLQPGQKSAQWNGHTLPLSAPPVEVKGTLLAPATVISTLFNVKITAAKGKPLDFHSSSAANGLSRKPSESHKIGSKSGGPGHTAAATKIQPGKSPVSVNPKKQPAAQSANRPPLSEQEIAAARKSGARLLAALQIGTMQLLNDERDRAQIKQLAYQGYYITPDGKSVALARSLQEILVHLANQSNKQHPFLVLSLYRPLETGRPEEPHGNGMAVDIAAFGGHRIESRKPEEAVAGVLAVINALPPGEYRMGLPKPPKTDPVALLPPPHRPAHWPFFPAPVPAVLPLFTMKIVQPRVRNSELIQDRNGRLQPEIVQWENERGAPPSAIGEARIRKALQEADRRGAHVYSLFPDALDHLHLDVRPMQETRETKS